MEPATENTSSGVILFYKLIKEKYNSNNKNFFSYFEKYYLKNNKFKKEMWNYSKVILNNINNNNLIFYTNNICESFNRTLNKKYIGYCKTMYNFQMCIYDIINFYNNHEQYKSKKISITRALEHYAKIQNHFELITDENLKMIKKNYKKYLTDNNLPIDDNESEDDVISEYEKKKPEEYSDESDSNDSDEDNIVSNIINNKKNDDDEDDDDDDSIYNNNKIKGEKPKNKNEFNFQNDKENNLEKNKRKNNNNNKKCSLNIFTIDKNHDNINNKIFFEDMYSYNHEIDKKSINSIIYLNDEFSIKSLISEFRDININEDRYLFKLKLRKIKLNEFLRNKKICILNK